MSPAERNALIGAGAAHILLFAALSIGWQWAQTPLPPANDPIPVDFVTIADAPRAPEPPPPSAEAAPQDSALPEPAEAAAPEPQPVPDAVPPPEPKPEPKPKPKPAEKTPMTAKPSPLDTSSLANLIDKALPKAKTKPLDTSKLAKDITAAQPRTATIDPRAAATLAQAIQAQVAPCWNPPTGGRDVRRMTVLIRVSYSRDGRVTGQPEIVGQTGVTPQNQDFARAFAETARRAVLRCQPLKLPADMYELWQSVDINFDPEQMA